MDIHDPETADGLMTTTPTSRTRASTHKKLKITLVIIGAGTLLLIIILVCVFATGGSSDKPDPDKPDPEDNPAVFLSKTPTAYQNESFTISWKTERMKPKSTNCTLKGFTYTLPNLTPAGEYSFHIKKAGSFIFTMDCVEYAENKTVTNTSHAQIEVVVLSVFAAGSGTAEDPYILQDCYALQSMELELDAAYILTKDIDCYMTRDWSNQRGFFAIGQGNDDAFTGTIDGQGHSVFELFIGRSDYCFVKDNSGIISNLFFRNAKFNITYGDGMWVGGVACSNDHIIHDVYFEGYFGEFGNPYYLGGLVAINHVYGNIDNCTAIVDMNLQLKTTSLHLGGLVGHNYGKINATSATGSIELNITDKQMESYPSSSASDSNQRLFKDWRFGWCFNKWENRTFSFSRQYFNNNY